MEKSYFFNSVGGDRKYDASSFAEYFSSVLTNGVHPAPSTSLQITADDTMFVEVQPGRAYINGYLYVNSLPKKLPITVSDGVLKRKDLIVCRLDMTKRTIITDVKKGTPSANPNPPNLTRTEVLYELALAEITINAAAPFISQANVLDTRLDKTRCGYINSLIQADTTTIFNDYKNWYETKTAEYETDIEGMKINFNQETATWLQGAEDYIQSIKDQIANDDHNVINGRLDSLEKTKIDWANIKEYGADESLEDNSPFIQEAINAVALSGGGTVFVPNGTWKIQKPIKLKSNIHFKSEPFATFVRNANITTMLINDSDGKKGGYEANKNIVVEGGIFDGNNDVFTTNSNIVIFGHAKNVQVKNAEFKNLNAWHFVEFNAVKNGKVQNCYFHDYRSSGTESIQLDIAFNDVAFPFFGPYDNTTCEFITIENNTFENVHDGIGSHTALSTAGTHKHITIIGNTFNNLTGTAIKCLEYSNLIIKDNQISYVANGITVQALYKQIYGVTIEGNHIFHANKNGDTSNGIRVFGAIGKEYYQVTIKGNTLMYIGKHGIGVDFCATASVEGNHIRYCGYAGIWNYASIYSHIRGNVVYHTKTDSKAVDTNGASIIVGNSGDSLPNIRVIVAGNTGQTLYASHVQHLLVEGNIFDSAITFGASVVNAKRINNIVRFDIE